ncbi:MAG: nucleoside kinase, partial [Lachnospiraceae bacterium]|nr:nucleoside kinase [Lachnospiraceae bacterium]
MLAVKVNGEMRTYPEGTAFLEIAKEFQPQYEDDILLVRVNGKLMELHKTLKKDSEVSFITFKDPVGKKTYERSAIFILMKAFYEIIPREKIKKVQIDFALGNGIYGELVGDVELDAELLQKVKAEMSSIVEQEIPIMKRNINTDDAVELFHNYGMLDKEQLFKFRRASRVNIYSIEKFEDYYYGYMVQNTGYVKYFDLIPYHKG